MRKVTFFSLFILMLLSSNAFGQTTPPLKVDKKIPVTGNENFDFIFTRSVMIGNVPTARIEGTRSGAYSFGIGYGLPVGKALLLKFEPRITWFKLYYQSGQEDKWLPSADTSATLISEKQRVSYLEVPVSLKFKLARNLVDRYKLLLEAGFNFGWKLGSTSKVRRYSDVDSVGTFIGPKITTKVNAIEDLSMFRFGPYARLGTNWLSVYGFYRMSEVFRTYRKFSLPDGTSRAYPIYPRLEIGVSIAL